MMTRGEANTVCVGDQVENMFGVKYSVADLEFTKDSDNNEVILAELSNDVRSYKVNLEICTKI